MDFPSQPTSTPPVSPNAQPQPTGPASPTSLGGPASPTSLGGPTMPTQPMPGSSTPANPTVGVTPGVTPSTPNTIPGTIPSSPMASPVAGMPVGSGPTSVPVYSGAVGGSVPPAMPSTPPTPVTSGGISSGGEEIHTMPEKFLQTGSMAGDGNAVKPKKGKGLTIVIIIVIVLAVLGIIGGVAYFIWQGLPQNQPDTTPTVTNATNTTNVTNTVNDNVNVNANANDNANANGNGNANVNGNGNANANANGNGNANVNGDGNANANTNASNINTSNANTNLNTNANTNSAAIVPSKDTDKDNLTNEEEKLYGTKADLPDTDSDGYNDGAEVLAGYDPQNSTSSGRLKKNETLVSTFANKEFKYQVLYPAAWLAEEVPDIGSNEVLLTPNTLDTAGQFIAITVEDNPTGFTAADWYSDQANVNASALKSITTFSGLTGVLSTDGSTAYFADDDYVYAVSYRFGANKEVHFGTTFTMITKSFQF